MQGTRGLSFSPSAQFRSLLKFQYSLAELLFSFQVHFLFEDPSGRYVVVAFWPRAKYWSILIITWFIFTSIECTSPGTVKLMVVKGMGVALANYSNYRKLWNQKIISDSVYASRNITKQNNCAFTALISLGIFGVFSKEGQWYGESRNQFSFPPYITLCNAFPNIPQWRCLSNLCMGMAEKED